MHHIRNYFKVYWRIRLAWPRIMINEELFLNASEAETGEQWMFLHVAAVCPCTTLYTFVHFWLYIPKIFYHFGDLQTRMPPYRSHFESFVFMRNNSIQRRRFATEQVIFLEHFGIFFKDFPKYLLTNHRTSTEFLWKTGLFPQNFLKMTTPPPQKKHF